MEGFEIIYNTVFNYCVTLMFCTCILHMFLWMYLLKLEGIIKYQINVNDDTFMFCMFYADIY